MTDTSLSLIDRICRGNDTAAWHRFAEVYTPLLRIWIARYEVQAADADDVIQEVLVTVANELPDFKHNQRRGAFRAWLRTILVHRLQRHFDKKRRHPVALGDSKVLQRLEELQDPTSELSSTWDKEHDRHVLLHLLRLISPRFSESTVQAFRRTTIEAVEPEVVAADLGISLNAVMIAKCRVLKELRREARGLLGDS